jgi:succinate-semialdehyde dehydrogenase / glutarate-semialdehyde dehydrogenase
MAVDTRTLEAEVVGSVPKQLFIGGEWRDATGGATLDVEDPSTGETIATVADATPEDALAALTAAAEAQAEWREHPPRGRGEILYGAYELMTERVERLALVMTLEMGKSVAESKAEVSYAAEFLRWFSEEAVRIDGRYQRAPTGAGRLLVSKQPVGPAYLITPWNFPAAMATRKIGPAVAAGCTMILKPASATPLSALAVTQILAEAGLPAGILNVITSSSSGSVSGPIIDDFRLRKLSFTGSTEVGRKLVEQSSNQLLRVSMELGGNAPFIVFEDADLDAAVEGAMIAKMRNIGEACTAANRFYVADALHDRFVDALAERMNSLRIGRGSEEGVDVGPLVSDDQLRKVEELVQDAAQRGAAVVCGGERGDGPGHFYRPTVLKDIPDDARLLREEIFGPVAPVKRFSDEEQAVRWANDTEFGLVAYMYTRDLGRAVRVMEALEYGMVGVNQGMVSNPAAPFGGVKHSGFGREGGYEGIEEYLETKYAALSFDTSA